MLRQRKVLFLLFTMGGLFTAAEVYRYSSPRTSAVLSVVGWIAFLVLFFLWLWQPRGPRAGIVDLARTAVLTCVAFGVLYLYYERSGILEAGIEIDAVYTYVALEHFLSLDQPITFAGVTPSYPQFPFTQFTHLPGVLIGFDRLGPFALHCGMMLQIALLLAILTQFLVHKGLGIQTLVVALAAGAFSFRISPLLYNLTGYAVPAICTGMMLLAVTLADVSSPTLFRFVGGLLCLSMLHHYPGVSVVLPIVVLWVVADRHPLRRVQSFVEQNPPVVGVFLILTICVAIHPHLLLTRIKDVTVQSQYGDVTAWLAKAQQNLPAIRWSFLPSAYWQLFKASNAECHVLNLPVLGFTAGLFILANWLMSALTSGRRAIRYLVGVFCFFLALVTTMGAMHLVTAFADHRDVGMAVGMLVTSLGFVFMLPRLRPAARVAVAAYAIGLSVYNYVDVGTLRGRRYDASTNHGARSQETLETLRRFLATDVPNDRQTTVYAVVEDSFPLQYLYMHDTRWERSTVKFIDDKSFCSAPMQNVDAAVASNCGPVVFAAHREACHGSITDLGWRDHNPGDTVLIQRYEGLCRASGQDTSAG